MGLSYSVSPIKLCIPLSNFVSPEVGLVLLVFESHVREVFFFTLSLTYMMYVVSV